MRPGCWLTQTETMEPGAFCRDATLPRLRDTVIMFELAVTSDAFAEAAANAGWLARQHALASGQSVVYVDAAGRYVEERPDGRKFEVRLDSSKHREMHRIVAREIVAHAA